MKSTRKYILAVCVLAIGFAVPSIQAQEDAPRPPKKEGGPRGDRAAMLKEKLGLTDAQTEQIKKIFADQQEAMKALREKEGDRESKKDAMKQIHEDTKAKIDAVLTAEQKAKMDTMREKRKDGPGGDKTPKGEKGPKEDGKGPKGPKGPPPAEDAEM